MDNQKTENILNIFSEALTSHGLNVLSTDEQGFMLIQKGEDTLKINAGNLVKEYLQTGDDTPAKTLAAALAEHGAEVPRNWEKAKESVYMSFQNHEFDFSTLIHIPVTAMLAAVFVYETGGSQVYITQNELDTWKIDSETLRDQAFATAEALLRQSSINATAVEDRELIYIDTEAHALKGALLFSYGFKEQMGVQLGYPFYGIFPARDFFYVFAEANLDFFCNRLGGVVKEEYLGTGHPATTEILKFTQDDVTAIGAYEIE